MLLNAVPVGCISYSFSFQKLKAMFSQPWVSQTPAIPSSPHRKALDRACSWGKSLKTWLISYQLSSEYQLPVLTTPSVTIRTVVFANCSGY